MNLTELEHQLTNIRLQVQTIDSALLRGEISLDEYISLLKNIQYQVNVLENKIIDMQKVNQA
jgi:hypothetical protein